MKDINRFGLGLVALAWVALSAEAHHAVNAQFDPREIIEVEGVLVKSELINPHTYVHLDVTADDKTVTTWSFEGASRAVVLRAGIPARELFQVGETYHIVAHPARNGGTSGLLMTMTLPDGRIVGFGSRASLDAGVEATRD